MIFTDSLLNVQKWCYKSAFTNKQNIVCVAGIIVCAKTVFLSIDNTVIGL